MRPSNEAIQQIFCPRCQRGNAPGAQRCRWCDASLTLSNPQQFYAPPMAQAQAVRKPLIAKVEARQVVGLIGALVLAVGAFMPIARFPVTGIISTLQQSFGVILAIAVTALVFSLLGMYRLMWIPGLIMLAVVVWMFLDIRWKADNFSLPSPEDGFWWQGMVFSAVGALILIVVSLIPPRRSPVMR